MSYNPEKILQDMSAFADLGTEAPTVVKINDGHALRIYREGTEIELLFRDDRTVVERYGSTEKTHRDLKALLASVNFADIGKWADSQKLILEDRLKGTRISLFGVFSSGGEKGDLEDFDTSIVSRMFSDNYRMSIFIIDGPAGIGKTGLIQSLSYNRAAKYRIQQRPLVLHVESRGRMLQNLTDLMAFSLQTIRSRVTYDQIPTLVRNGLVTLAIDGFDELGDPNGYELAWAQVNELIKDCRGHGSIILSGRETFIGRDRVLSALNSIDTELDCVESFTLQPIEPETAREWLISSGWPVDVATSEASRPLFDLNSYALRPFFLVQLSGPDLAAQIANGEVDDILAFIVEKTIDRETGKFGRDVEAATSQAQRKEFVHRMMEEIARDMADNQSDAISIESITWIAEMVASECMPDNVAGILRKRAEFLAFLTNDDRRGYRRFSHEKLANYFISHVTIQSVVSGEIPKYIRRNIFGTDMLESFFSVARTVNAVELEKFIQCAIAHIDAVSDYDRARRNLGALVIAAACVVSTDKVYELKMISIDEAYATETISNLSMSTVAIAQLFAREADLRKVRFREDCYIGTLIADGATIPSQTMPIPSRIDTPGRVINDHAEIKGWLEAKIEFAFHQTGHSGFEEEGKESKLFDLLTRVVRYRPFWIKAGEDKMARRILDDPNWQSLANLMKDYDLLTEREDVAASGRPGKFYHVKNRQALLNWDKDDENIALFIDAVLRMVNEDSGARQ